MDEVFEVAVTAFDRRLDDTSNGPAGFFRPGDELVADSLMDRGVLDDAATGDVGRASFELRLEQHDANRTRRGARLHRGKHLAQRNKGEVGDEEVERREFGKVAGVGAFEEGDTRVVPELLMELGAADIDGKDGACTVLQEAVGKTASRGAKVDAVEARGVDGEGLEGRFEFAATAAHVAFRCDEFERRLRIEELSGLDQGERAGANLPGHDEAACLFACFGEAAFKQEDVSTQPHRAIVDCRSPIVDRLRFVLAVSRRRSRDCSRFNSSMPRRSCRLSAMEATERVRAALEELGLSADLKTFDESTRTAQDAANAVGCELGQIVKTLYFSAEGRPTLVLVAGDRQADTAKVAEILGIGRKKLKMGAPEEVLAHTGYPVGGVSPVGTTHPCDVIVDDSLQRFRTIWAAAGNGNTVFSADAERLVEAVNGQWANITREPV